MTAGNAEEFERAAEQLCEVVDALEAVDLNLLSDDEVRQVLDAKDEFVDVCLQYREKQHATQDRAEDTVDLAAARGDAPADRDHQEGDDE